MLRAACVFLLVTSSTLPQVDGLAWLSGRWLRVDGNERSEEHWMEPAGGSLVGMNRTVKDGKTVFFEYLRIAPCEDTLCYLASPKGRDPPTSFRLVKLDGQSAVFENPKHDFPQRIRYTRKGNTLTARIEGITAKAAPVEWTWSLVE